MLHIKKILEKREVKRQCTECREIFTTHTLTQNSYNSDLKKWVDHLNKNFSIEDIKMINKHKKRCLTLIILNEMYIETLMNNLFHTY